MLILVDVGMSRLLFWQIDSEHMRKSSHWMQ